MVPKANSIHINIFKKHLMALARKWLALHGSEDRGIADKIGYCSISSRSHLGTILSYLSPIDRGKA